MKGFKVGDRYDTMGLRANDLRRLSFNDVRIPPENVLGEPGEGFRIAMAILNNGRIGLGTGSVGGAKMLIDMAIAHVTEREQFGAPLADLELVQEKIGWMVSYLFGVESMCYLTTGLVDRGVEDYSLESAMLQDLRDRVPLVPGQPRAAARRRRGLHAHRALREDPARHPHLPDLRGRQRRAALVRRAQRAEAASARSSRGSATSASATRSARSACWPTTSARGSGRTRSRRASSELQRHADAVAEQVGRLRSTSEKLLREHRGGNHPQGPAPPADVRRARRHLRADRGACRGSPRCSTSRASSASGQERHIARSFCKRAERRVHGNFDQIESNDDEHITDDRQARLQARLVRLRALR